MSQPPRHTRPRLFLIIGLPGCGKTTLAKSWGIAPVVSSDQIREQLYGNENIQGDPKRVFGIFNEHLKLNLLHPPYAVVADSTSLQAFARASIVEVAKECDAEIHVIFFRNPAQAVARNNMRERKVPADVMGKMLARYERTIGELSGEARANGYASVTEISGTSGL